MPNNVLVDPHKIVIQIDNSNQYESIKKKILENGHGNIEQNFFNQKYLIKPNILENYQHYFAANEQKIIFTKMNNGEIFYEEFDSFLKYIIKNFDLPEKEKINQYLNDAILNLNVQSMIFLMPQEKKFLINLEGDYIVLNPIQRNILKNDESLKEYYKKMFELILESLEGFIRSRIRIINNRIIINYQDAIDQFFYILKKIISSEKLFEQKFDHKKYLNNVLHFMIKNIALSQINSLRNALECSENHPLNKFRHLSLITYKLFNKLIYIDGDLTALQQNDILQLSDAFLYENVFENSPLFISNVYNKICKVLPFRILEKIIKKQKINEYQF